MARSFDIYELWCFQETVRQFTTHTNIQPTFSNVSLSNHRSRWGMKAHFESDTERWTLEYNAQFPSRNFGKFPIDTATSQQHSILTEMRPDIVVTYEDVISKHKKWLVLDAKYRTSMKNLSSAFDSAVVYGQTLVYPKYGGFPQGCYLLVPKKLPKTQFWFGSKYANQYGFAAFEYRPGVPSDSSVFGFIQQCLVSEDDETLDSVDKEPQ